MADQRKESINLNEKNMIPLEDRMRIIQEMVPGKQVTLAHIIANPDKVLYQKLGMKLEMDTYKGAIGIVTVSPSEAAIIVGDIAMKASSVELDFIDRVSGTLIVTGSIAEVEAALHAVVEYCEIKLGFSICEITRT